MSRHYLRKPGMAGGAAVGATVFGAVLGGAAVAAGTYPKVRSGEMARCDAVREVAREAGTTGVSAGAGVAVAGALGLGGVLSFVGIVAVATGTKYALDSALKHARPKEAAAVEEQEKPAETAVPEKPKSKAGAKAATKGATKTKAKSAKSRKSDSEPSDEKQ